MFNFVVFAYAMLVCFIFAAMRRNAVVSRPNPQVVVAFGWGLMSFSGVMGLLLGATALAQMSGAGFLQTAIV